MNKKLSVVFLVLFSTCLLNKALAQNFVEISYNAAIPMEFDNLNFIIDRYNETRDYLDLEMKNVTYLDGKSYSIGERFGNYEFAVGYTGAGNKVKAEGYNNSGLFIQRQVKVKTSVFNLSFSCDIMQMKNGSIQLGFGLQYGRFKVKTRVEEKEVIRKAEWDYINIADKQLITVTAFLRYSKFRPGFFLQPYIQYMPGEFAQIDLTVVNETLNPYTYGGDPSPLNVSNMAVGLKIGIRFFYME